MKPLIAIASRRDWLLPFRHHHRPPTPFIFSKTLSLINQFLFSLVLHQFSFNSIGSFCARIGFPCASVYAFMISAPTVCSANRKDIKFSSSSRITMRYFSHFLADSHHFECDLYSFFDLFPVAAATITSDRIFTSLATSELVSYAKEQVDDHWQLYKGNHITIDREAG